MTIIILQSDCISFLFILNYSFLGLSVRRGLISAFVLRLARFGA